MRWAFLFILISSILLINTSCIKKETSTMTLKKISTDKNALFVIAFKGFQDWEYSKSREILEAAGVKVTVASSSLGTATGKFGKRVDSDLTINEVNIADYDVIIFIGGPGATEFIDNQTAHKLVREAVKNNKILAAICIAPEILAKAGVLANKKATVWSSIVDRSSIDVLKDSGAQYLDQEIVVDGKIITANGPEAAEKFAAEILKNLE